MSTHSISFFIKNVSEICSYGIFSKGLKNEFETAVVNEPSVFEPRKVFYIRTSSHLRSTISYYSKISTVSKHLLGAFFKSNA